MIIINPGTEPQTGHNEANAMKLADYIVSDLGLPNRWERTPEADDQDGWYGFTFELNGNEVEVDIPGIDADVVREGRPFKSPRLYVNGSSWLYGYALGFIERGLKGDENETLTTAH